MPALGSHFDDGILNQAEEFIAKSQQNIEAFRFREALAEAMNVARLGNKFLADEEPWKLIKKDEEKTKSIIHIALQLAQKSAKALEVFIPSSSAKIKAILNLEDDDNIGEGHSLNKAEILFPKIEDETIEKQIAKLKSKEVEAPKEEKAAKANISFEDFLKLDIRTAKIVSAERIEKADKLLKLTVDMGNETRTIVSGIAEHYSPEELPGKSVSVMANLAPKKLRGVESQGMILMAEDEDGKLAFITPEISMAPGSEIR